MKYNIGDKRGKYEILSIRGKSKKRVFRVRCECGIEKDARPDNYAKNKYGCPACTYRANPISARYAAKAKRKPYEDVATTRIFQTYHKSARQRSIDFNISYLEFSQIICKPCHYCGDPPNNVWKKVGNRFGNYRYSGIDRKNNNIGYILFNCVPCCKTCNFLKRDLDYDIFLLKIEAISKNLIL